MKTIDNSGIVEKHSNNGKTQTILIEHNNSLFRILIHVENYEFKSYATLSILNEQKEWTILKKAKPIDYNITSFYAPFELDKFQPIISDLKKLIKKLDVVLK